MYKKRQHELFYKNNFSKLSENTWIYKQNGYQIFDINFTTNDQPFSCINIKQYLQTVMSSLLCSIDHNRIIITNLKCK